jgi:hypothetical protein
MRTPVWIAAVTSVFLITTGPALADRDRGWDRGGRSYVEDVKRACHYGNRRACVKLGELKAERRHDRWARNRWDDRRYDDHRGWR